MEHFSSSSDSSFTLSAGMLDGERKCTISECLDKELESQLPLLLEEPSLQTVEKLLLARLALETPITSKAGHATNFKEIYISLAKASSHLLLDSENNHEIIYLSPVLISILRNSLKLVPCEEAQKFATLKANDLIISIEEMAKENCSNLDDEELFKLALIILDCLLSFMGDLDSNVFSTLKLLTTQLTLSRSESISSFSITNLLPRIVSVDNNIIEEIWEELLTQDFCNLNLTPLCLLMNIFLANKSSTNFLHKNEVWTIIQNGIISRDQMKRKQARFMLKRALDFISTNCLILKTDNFEWNGKSSLEPWQNFFLVIESLEEKQVHIIKPVLSLIDKLFKELDSQWTMLALHQAVHHDNLQIVKWGFNFFFGLPPCPKRAEFFLLHLLSALDDTSLYHESDLGDKLESFAVSMATTTGDNLFFKHFLLSVSAISWGPVPLYFVCKSLGGLPKFATWDSADLGNLKKFLVDAMATQDVFLRATCQSMLLRATISLLDLPKVAPEAWLDLLASFNKKESLARGLKDWQLLVDFIQQNPPLHFSGKEILSMEAESKISVKAVARYMVLLSDADVLKKEELEILSKEFEWHLAEIESRPYCLSSSPNQIDTLVELTTQISSELGVKFEWSGSLLSQLISHKSFLGLWGYLKRRLEGGECEDPEFLLIYVDCLKQSLNLDKDLAKLLDHNKLILTGAMLLEQNEKSLFTKYFAAKMLEMFSQDLSLLKSELATQSLFTSITSLVSSGSINNVVGHGKSTESASLRNKLISGILTANWSSFACLLDWKPNSILINLSHASLMDLAEDAVERGGPETLPWIMSCLKHFVHNETDATRVRNLLKKTYTQCFEHRKSELFWSSIRQFVAMAFSKEMMLRSDLEDDLLKFTDSLYDQSQCISGLFNLVIENVSKQEAMNKVVIRQLKLALVFGQICKKDQKILNDACMHIITLGNEIPANTLLESNCQASQNVRVSALKFLLLNAQDTNFTGLLADALVSKDEELSKNKKLRYFADSHIHREKHRIAQTLLVISCCNPEFLVTQKIFEWGVSSLGNENHQPSVRYYIEWLISLILIRNGQILKGDFFAKMLEATSTKTTCIPSFISVLFLWIVGCASEKTDDFFIELLNSTIELLLPWCMAQNYSIRLYGQVALLRIFAFCEDSGVHKAIGSFKVLKDSIRASVEQSSGVKNAIKLQEDFFFSVFDPLKHLTLESITLEFPRLTNVGSDEWLPITFFKFNQEELLKLPFALWNADQLLSNSPVANWILKATGGNHHSEETDDTSYSVVQRKVMPWSAMFPENSAREHHFPPLGGLVVVASLIDKAPNLGGLSRTCEIFGASELVIGNMKIVDDPSFQSLSVTAEKWINLSEVKPPDLVEYLNHMKKLGYVLMAAEQTSKSQPLQNVKFSKKTLVLLGNEKEGIPAELLPFLDVCVEIPQSGVIRSLNVHVTGALFVWQYFQQQILTTKE